MMRFGFNSITVVLLFTIFGCNAQSTIPIPKNIVAYEVNPQKQNLQFFYKNKAGHRYINAAGLRDSLWKKKQQELIFAVNGGMYHQDRYPVGLYVEGGQTLSVLDTLSNGRGNFYLYPNGVFYLTNNRQAHILSTKAFQNQSVVDQSQINYATQSGPMLLIDGKIHPKFREPSTNLNIRNGVGILPNGNVLFAISKTPVNLYSFAQVFLDQGCQQALYLDGFVSRAYLPEQGWEQVDGDFGVLIGVVE